MRLNYIQEQQVIRSRELLGTDGTEHMEQQRDEGAAVQASRDSTRWMCQVRRRESSDGHQKAQMDAHQKAQMDGHQKVAQELLEARAETTHAGWSPAQPHVRHRDGKSWDV